MSNDVLTPKKLRQEFSARNKSRMPQISELSRQAAEQNPYYLFNLRPMPFLQRLGSLGTFFIPAREPNERVSKPCVIPGTIFEGVWVGTMGEGEPGYREKSGLDVARDVLGIGPNQDPRSSLLRWGVFLSSPRVVKGVTEEVSARTPSEADVQAAQARLTDTYRQLVREADGLYTMNNGMAMVNGVPVSNITTQHFEAVKALGLKKPYVGDVAQQRECEECGTLNLPSAARCKNCRSVFDLELARQRFPEEYGVRTAEAVSA